MRSGEEIQQALRAFAARWAGFAGTERGEAQTFLNELIECYGGNRRDQGAVFEDAHTSDGIMDMYREIAAGTRSYDPLGRGAGQTMLGAL